MKLTYLFVCMLFSITSQVVANDYYESNKFDTQTIEAESLLANYYLENGNYHQAYVEYAKLMKRNLSFTQRFYIQNTLAWLIINGYGTKQDVFKATDLYYDSYRDLMISEVNAAQYMNQQEKL
jgi:hypothetical protein